MLAARHFGSGFLFACGLACSTAPVFACQEDDACGPGGTCNAMFGYCTFPSDDCESGQRFGEHAGEGLAGQCVVPMDGSGGSDGADDSVVDDGADDGATGSASTSASDDTTGAPGECAACVPLAPADWSGPVVVIAGDGAPTCPAIAPRSLDAGHAGLVAPPASCMCECDTSDRAACPGVTVYADLAGSCEATGLPLTVTPDSCQTVDANLLPAGATLVGVPDESPLMCAPSVQANVSRPQWGSDATLCTGAEPAACDGGVCLDDLALDGGASWCIYREGEHACPAGAYADASVYHRSWDDSRGCSACACEPDPNAACTLSVYDGDCEGEIILEIPLAMPECIDVDQLGAVMTIGATVTAPAPGLACSVATASEPIGAATPTSPFTVCCVR